MTFQIRTLSKSTVVIMTSLSIALSACAKSPSKVEATYISPEIYAGFSCKQIVAERNNIVAKVNEATGKQKKNAENDAVAMTVGLILFWPSLFFIGAGKKVDGQLASYKGNYDALTTAGEKKRCFPKAA